MYIFRGHLFMTTTRRTGWGEKKAMCGRPQIKKKIHIFVPVKPLETSYKGRL